MRAALYARYSTDSQSESSISDQFRVCGDWCERERFEVVARYQDQAISGAAIGNRPGARAMLQAGLAAQFDVLVVMDLSRLSRSQADLPKIIDRLTIKGIRIIGVQDGYDSARKGHKLQAGLSGIIGEAFREMISERTYSSHEMRARQGRPTGGRAYGYAGRQIVAEQAEVVREIFGRFAEGDGLRSICTTLNTRGVPAPGAGWNRTKRRADGKWMVSSLFSMLRNPLYIGQVIWNRSDWIKDPDTGRRLRRERPESAWIRHQFENLRIVPDHLWSRVQARIGRQAAVIAARLGEGRARHQAIATGRGPKYVLSGLLVCDACGAKLVIVDRYNYGCSTHHHGGRPACANDVRLSRAMLQKDLLAAIEQDLLSDEAVAEAGRRYARAVREQSRPTPVDPGRVLALQAQVANLVQAIAGGLNSPALAARLAQAEGELARLQTQADRPKRASVTRLLPRIGQEYRALVHRLAETLNETDPARGRAILRELVGEVRMEVDEKEIRLISRHAGIERALARAAGAPLQISVVAGA